MKKILIFLFILLLFLPLWDLFHSGLPITHDGQDHVARIANFYQNLSEGIVIPRWAGNLDWGYGHPILMFLYPFPSYITSLIHFCGFSFVDSVKIFFGLAFIASGLAMYLWLKEFLSKEAAFIGAMLYLFAPYRFVDLYVRGAIGEHAAFIFPPLVLYFMFKLSRLDSWFAARNDRWGGYWYLAGGALSLAGLILAHNAISLMFLPLIFLYAVFLIWQAKKKRKLLIAYCLLLIAFGFFLSAFFWMPAFIEGKYTLRDKVTEGSVNGRFAEPIQLLYGPWSYGGTGQLSVQVGIVQWLLVVISLPLLLVGWLKDKKKPVLLLSSLLFFFFTLFLITGYSQPIWETVSTLQKFQFPWRFLSLSTFLAAVIGAIVSHQVFTSKVIKSSRGRLVLIVLFIAAILFVNKDYWHAKGYLYKPESFYTGIYDSPTDTGESAPIWSVRFMEKRPKAHMEIIDGTVPNGTELKVKIKDVKRTSTFHQYTIDTDQKVRLRENTLYFPGWKVLVDGVALPVEFQDPKNRGLMTFFIEKGKHDIVIKFEETKLRMAANWISLLSLVLLISWGILRIGSRQVIRS